MIVSRKVRLLSFVTPLNVNVLNVCRKRRILSLNTLVIRSLNLLLLRFTNRVCCRMWLPAPLKCLRMVRLVIRLKFSVSILVIPLIAVNIRRYRLTILLIRLRLKLGRRNRNLNWLNRKVRRVIVRRLRVRKLYRNVLSRNRNWIVILVFLNLIRVRLNRLLIIRRLMWRNLVWWVARLCRWRVGLGGSKRVCPKGIGWRMVPRPLIVTIWSPLNRVQVILVPVLCEVIRISRLRCLVRLIVVRYVNLRVLVRVR